MLLEPAIGQDAASPPSASSFRQKIVESRHPSQSVPNLIRLGGMRYSTDVNVEFLLCQYS